MTAPRALVLRALGLGDYLAGVPALRALRRALPAHELVLAAPRPISPLVQLTGAVDTLLPTGELEPVAWSGPPPDLGVDLHGNGPASKRLVQATQPARLVAFAGPDEAGRPVTGPDWDPEEHERARWCRLVADAFGLAPHEADPDDLMLEEPWGEPPVRDAVVVHAGAAYPSRRWPAERYAAVARSLAGAGERVVLTGSPGERELVEQVRRAAGLAESAVLAGRTDLAGLAALVAAARLVVCGDTGVAHLASAYRIPSVLLFGPTPPWRWGPPASGPHTVLWHGDRAGDPHGTAVDPALLRVEVDEVVSAAEIRLAALPGRPG